MRSNHFENHVESLARSVPEDDRRNCRALKKPTQVGTVFQKRMFRFLRNPKYSATGGIGKFCYTCFRENRD